LSEQFEGCAERLEAELVAQRKIGALETQLKLPYDLFRGLGNFPIEIGVGLAREFY
jgi:hypothetical protein